MLGFLRMGTMVEVLKYRGTWHCSSDLLNGAANTEPTGLHAVAGDTLSGPDAFLVFWLRKRLPSLSSGSVGSLLIVADFALYCAIVCRPCHTARVLLEEN